MAGDATTPPWNGYRLTVTGPCGVVFERWGMPQDAAPGFAPNRACAIVFTSAACFTRLALVVEPLGAEPLKRLMVTTTARLFRRGDVNAVFAQPSVT
jgi:hypothetical protein